MFVLGDGLDDGINAVILPVEGIDIPLDGVVATFLGSLDYCVVVIAVRRAEEYHFFPGQFLDVFVWFGEFFLALGEGECGHLLVVLAVVAKVVPGGKDGFDIVRVFVHPSARHEEGYAHVMFGEDFEDAGSVLVAPRGWLLDGTGREADKVDNEEHTRFL